jgi:hypothetical protein
LNTCNRLKNLLENANGLHKQLNHVKELIKNVIQNETGGGNMFDLELLLQGCILEGREQIEDKSIQHISSSHGEQKVHVQVVQQTIDFYIEHSQKSLGESALCLEELQSLVEEALPHLIGNNCALQ